MTKTLSLDRLGPSRQFLSRHWPLLLALSYATPGLSQSQATDTRGDDSEDRATLDEVFVTAQKRGQENLQDVPLSIQAITADTLQRAGATDIQSIARLSPSIRLVETGTSSYQIYMRGIISTAAENATQDNPLVSVYLDDVPASFANFNPNIEMFDVERVEVLRGPQGTLYGAGSMGGNLRIVNALPDTRNFLFKAEALTGWTSGGDESYGLKGMINLPALNDKLGFRAVATWQENGGFIDNALTGEKNVNNVTRNSARISARWLTTDKLTIGASVLWQDSDADDRQRRMIPGTQTLFDNVGDEGEFTVVKSLREPFEDTHMLTSLTLEYDLGWSNLLSSTAYYDRDFLNPQQPFFPEFFEKLVTGAVTIASPLIDDWAVHNTVQEFRLSSPVGSRVVWVLGAYYSDQYARFVDNWPAENFEEITGIVTTGYGAPRNNLFSGKTTNELKELALFAELTYPLTERVDGTIGLRGFRTEQKFFQFFSGFFNGGVTIVEQEPENDEVTPKVSLAYRISDDAMLYATAAKGHRLGGVNDPVPPDLCADQLAELGLTEAPKTFGPESLWNYEIGAKTSWLDRQLTVNATLFRLNWSDMQTRNVLSGCGFFFSENVGEATSTGVELEMIARPTGNLTLSLAAAYTDAQLSKDVPNLGAEKGAQAPHVPKFSASGSVDYSHRVAAELDGFMRLDVQHVGSRTTGFGGGSELPAYELGSIHLGLQDAERRWSVEAFLNNIWDEDVIYTAGGVPFTGAGATEVVERPRMVGLRFNWNY